jgi:hypothetical protein
MGCVLLGRACVCFSYVPHSRSLRLGVLVQEGAVVDPGIERRASEAQRLVERFEWHYTPKHGSRFKDKVCVLFAKSTS